MPLPVIADVSRCVFNWSGTDAGEAVVSVQHFQFAGSGADLAGFLDADVTTHLFEGLNDLTLAATVDITPLDGISGAETFPLTNWHGSSGSGQILPGFCLMVLGSTGFRGPRNRGRLFLPSPLESLISNGLFDEANRAETETAWNDYRAALEADGVLYGVASYVHSEFNPYTTLTMTRKVGIIRRRRAIA